MEYSHLEHYLRTGKYHPTTPDYKKRGIRKASHNFVIKGSKLIYVGKGRMQVVCRNDEDKKKAIQWCHNNRENIHEPCGIRETIKLLQNSYYWHGLNRDIEKRLFPCEICSSEFPPHSSSLAMTALPPPPAVSSQLDLSNRASSSPSNGLDLTNNVKREVFESNERFIANENGFHPPSHAREFPQSPHVEGQHMLEEDDVHRSSDPEDSYATLPFTNSGINTSALELLFERISQLQALNSALIDENHVLKEKIKTLHDTLENQRNLPLLQDLIQQLRSFIPRASCSKDV